MGKILFGHIIVQTGIVLIQCIEVITFLELVYFDGDNNRGDSATLIAISTLTGLVGIALGNFNRNIFKLSFKLNNIFEIFFLIHAGILLSSISRSYILTQFISLGFFFISHYLCGILWPIEAMPYLLKLLAQFFPLTLPSISVRNIVDKGWSFAQPQVFNGFAVLIGWIILPILISYVVLKWKK